MLAISQKPNYEPRCYGYKSYCTHNFIFIRADPVDNLLGPKTPNQYEEDNDKQAYIFEDQPEQQGDFVEDPLRSRFDDVVDILEQQGERVSIVEV